MWAWLATANVCYCCCRFWSAYPITLPTIPARLKDSHLSISVATVISCRNRINRRSQRYIICRYFENWVNIRHNQNTMLRLLFLIKLVQFSMFYNKNNLHHYWCIVFQFYYNILQFMKNFMKNIKDFIKIYLYRSCPITWKLIIKYCLMQYIYISLLFPYRKLRIQAKAKCIFASFFRVSNFDHQLAHLNYSLKTQVSRILSKILDRYSLSLSLSLLSLSFSKILPYVCS